MYKNEGGIKHFPSEHLLWILILNAHLSIYLSKLNKERQIALLGSAACYRPMSEINVLLDL